MANINVYGIDSSTKQPRIYRSGDTISGVSPSTSSVSITQSSHGFVAGDWVRHNGSIWTKAQGNTIANCTGVWFVSAVADTNNFTVVKEGRVTGLSGYTAGQLLYLSTATAGATQTTLPIGTTSTPLGFYLPVAYVESSSVIHVLGSGYPTINPILAEYIHTDTLNQAFNITFSNLDVAAYGGVLEFEIGMGGITSGASDTRCQINGLTGSNYNYYVNYDTGSAWSRSAATASTYFLLAYVNNNNSDQQLSITGKLQLSKVNSASCEASITSEYSHNSGFGTAKGYYTSSVTNITSVKFGDGNFSFRTSQYHYARLIWKGPRS